MRPLAGYTSVFRTCRRLQNLEEIETNRLLDLTVVRFVRSSLMSVTRTSLRRQKLSIYCSWARADPETPGRYPIHCPISAITQFALRLLEE